MALETPSNILSQIAGVGTNVPQFGPDYNAIAQMQRTQLAVQNAQQVQQAENALKAAFSGPNFDPKTLSLNQQGWGQLAQASPSAFMEARNSLAGIQEKQARLSSTNSKWMEDVQDRANDMRVAYLDRYDKNLAGGMLPDAARRDADDKVWGPKRQELVAGMPAEMASTISAGGDPMQARQRLAEYKAVQSARLDASKPPTIETDYGQQPPLEYYKYPSGRTTLMDGRTPHTPSGVGRQARSDEPEPYQGTVDGKVVTIHRGARGGWLNDKNEVVTPTNVHRMGTKGEDEAKYGKVSQIAIDDPDTPGETKIIPAQQDQKSGQWVTADANREPLPTPRRIVSTGGGGRQAEAQALAMINAGNEATASLKNLVELPVGATSGWFKGLTSMPADSLAANIRRGIAGEINDRDSRSLQISWQGIGRSLATLEAAGRATGLVGLQKQAESLMPQKGDTYTNVLRSYAEIRQIVERSIETMKSAPGVSSDQKKLLNKIEAEAKSTVPWTVHDVNMLETGGKDSALEFAKKVKVGAAGEGSTSPHAAPSAASPSSSGVPEMTEQQYNAAPPGTPYRMPGSPKVLYKP